LGDTDPTLISWANINMRIYFSLNSSYLE
jgi:hypothetical protein